MWFMLVHLHYKLGSRLGVTYQSMYGIGKPHTRLGTRKSSNKKNGEYLQGREFDSNGKVVRDIDCTDHGRPNIHSNPHQHKYSPNETGGTMKRGGPECIDLDLSNGPKL